MRDVTTKKVRPAGTICVLNQQAANQVFTNSFSFACGFLLENNLPEAKPPGGWLSFIGGHPPVLSPLQSICGRGRCTKFVSLKQSTNAKAKYAGGNDPTNRKPETVCHFNNSSCILRLCSAFARMMMPTIRPIVRRKPYVASNGSVSPSLSVVNKPPTGV